MKYTIYKITNTLNGKVYIGKHQTADVEDGYMGSGKHLKRAQTKHGHQYFRKEILHIFDSEEEMNAKERELVTEDFCSRNDTYNICVGGRGGFSHINKTGVNNRRRDPNKTFKKISQSNKGKHNHSEYIRDIHKARHAAGHMKPHYFGTRETSAELAMLAWSDSARAKREETRSKNEFQRGPNNSSWGKIFITNGETNLKVRPEEFKAYEALGFRKGRTDKKKQ